MKIFQPLLFVLLFSAAFACKDKKDSIPAVSKPSSAGTPAPVSQELPTNPYASVDISPMDMSYFPVDYPKLKMAGNAIDKPVARVIYSRPHLQKRHLFHDLLKYEEPWRLGANEATEIDFYKPVIIQEKKIQPGRYILYAIPHVQTWTIVLNSNIDSWGLRPDPAKDIEKFEIPVTAGTSIQEYFTMVFEHGEKNNAHLLITWDNLVAKLPFSY